jgi:hypothetical protein
LISGTFLSVTAATVLAAASPARGAPLSDIVPASIVALVAVLALAAVAISHRRGSFPVLARWGAISERVGLPGWAGVPIVVATVSLLVAAFGFYWDVSWHIDRGRDPGPFANPAHWFIIVGLAGIALSGVLAVIMGDDRDSGASIRLADGWRVPVGALLLTVCGCLALAGFPLDDAWHRIFGQDVTLWGPTHIQMIGGASLATLAMWILMVEGQRVRRRGPEDDSARNWVIEHQDIFIGGAFLIGMSTLQAEFDFGVPQFRQLYHPVLLMLGASVALVAVRLRAGRGSALAATLFFLAIRGLLTLLIGPVLGRTILHFPLYLVEALIVEVVVARVGEGRQLTVGLWAGAGIGTVGLAAEWVWSHLWMPFPWHASLLPEAAVFGFLAAMAGGVLGGLAGRALAPPDAPRQATPRGLAAAAWVAALLCIAYPLPITAPKDISAHVRTTDVAVGPDRHVNLDIQMRPANAAEHADWFTVTSWQGRRTGDGGLVLASLHKVGPGHYVTTKPVPADGEWKTTVRLQKGRELVSMPVYMPQDDAIPAPLIAAFSQFDRPFVRDKSLLQREAIGGSPGQQRAAYAGIGVIALAWIASLGWGLRRLDRSATGAGPTIDVREDRRHAPAA